MSVGTEEQTAAPSDVLEGSSPDAAVRWVNRLALGCVVAAVAPVVVATVRAIANDWVPVGDNAYFALRSRDVLTEHHPWIGSWTSASQTLGVNMNNPGPLYFDALALPAKVGGDAGLAVGVALLNVAAILGIALAARRVAGARGVIVGMLAAAGLGWAMGSELLFDPWQPHSLMLPFLCLLVLVWALAAGDLALLPWTAGLASFILQTHIGYALVVPMLALWGVGAAGLGLWRVRRTNLDAWTADWRRARRYLAVTAVVMLACWSQSIYEQFLGPGRGNLSRLASSLGTPQQRVGLGTSPRLVAQVVALPPWWGRPSMSESFAYFFQDTALPSRPTALLGLLAVSGLLAGAFVLARRHSDAPATMAAATGIVVLGVTLLAVTSMPVADYGLAAHHLRWLWPVAVFLTFAAVLGLLTRPGREGVARIGLGALGAATVTLGVLSLPAMNVGAGPSADAPAIPAIRELLPQLRVLEDERGVLFDITELRFAEPYSWPIMSELQRLGVPFYVDDPGMVRQIGSLRAGPGDASVRLYLREGAAAHEVAPGAQRVAFANDLAEAEDAELAALQDELAPFITGGGLRLTGAEGPDGEVSEAQLRDPDYLFAIADTWQFQRRLVSLVEGDRLDVPERWSSVLERYAELQQRADRFTVAVFVTPADVGL